MNFLHKTKWAETVSAAVMWACVFGGLMLVALIMASICVIIVELFV